MSKVETLIIGGGAIGLSIGWKLAKAGRNVMIVERESAGGGATRSAGGMLAPAAEVGFEELGLYAFSRESLKMWPSFAEELEAESGIPIDYRKEGTIVVADDRDSAEALRRTYEFQMAHDVPVEWLTPHEALEVEPFLSPKISGAVLSPEDHQVDNRLMADALRVAFLRAGGELREASPVTRIKPDDRTPAVVLETGERFEAELVVLAAGCWSRMIDGLEKDARPPVRPVKGQMIELKMKRPFDLRHVVRGPHGYLCPKSDGRLLIGATSEEMGFDTTVTAGGVFSLLEGAWEIVPGIYELEVTGTWAGLRPASRDHAPLIGYADAPRVYFATGHYRHGILLAPVTGELAAEMILTGSTPELLRPFDPKRFLPAVA